MGVDAALMSCREEFGETIEIGSSMSDLEVEDDDDDGPGPSFNVGDGDGEVNERLFDKTPGEDDFEGDFF